MNGHGSRSSWPNAPGGACASSRVANISRHHAHCLNRTAALVWRRCDGQSSIADVAAELRDELKIAAGEDEKLARLALDRLGAAQLLQAPIPHAATLSRRRVLRGAGLVGAMSLLVPVVESIVAPRAAEAASTISDAQCEGSCIGVGLTCAMGGTCVRHSATFCECV
jgi:hypothetical protein